MELTASFPSCLTQGDVINGNATEAPVYDCGMIQVATFVGMPMTFYVLGSVLHIEEWELPYFSVGQLFCTSYHMGLTERGPSREFQEDRRPAFTALTSMHMC